MRIPSGKILLATAPVALAFLAVALKLWIGHVETRRWEDLRSRLADLAHEVRARDGTRPALRGSPTPGNAWDDYQPALLKLRPPDWQAYEDFISRSPKADRAKIEAWVISNAWALDALRRGVGRSAGRREIDWEAVPPAMIPGYPLGALARCRARLQLEAGQPQEAAERLLEIAQFSGDAVRNGTVLDGILGAAILSFALEDLKDLVLSKLLSREDLLEIGRKLERVDRGYPREGDLYVNDALMTGYCLFHSGDVKTFYEKFGVAHPKISAWRYGFSERIMMAEAFDVDLKLARRRSEKADGPWIEAATVQQEVRCEQDAVTNPLFTVTKLIFTDSSSLTNHRRSVLRERRAQLRLLRGAAHYRATGELLLQEDPYGDRLLSTTTGDRAKLWSVAGDGRDDGGDGGWTRDKGKDIVLEVDR
jgi:hypothetical protein